ncbi:VOC family protein [Phenylobacterium sp.]|jgi:catechol 2,3-dioxygenase-like lactoylglutathione lyase family enzyme|uniref:VOC family protein n=1 Tax=Phenylobacterium sp. TaxID=1871053 RepID=UPI002F935926
MISGLDHVAVAVRDFDAVADGYRRLLGVEPELEPGDGAVRAWFRFPNMALEVIGPDGEGAAGDRVRAQLEASGDGVWIVAFAVEDVDAAARLAERRGLSVAVRTPRAALIDVAGVRVSLIADGNARSGAAGAVAALDHVVIRTPDIDRAVANYGGRLGLDLRLDRANEAWGARQLFFRCGDAVVEFGASLKHPPSDGPDSFGGLAWRVTDPDAAHAAMAAAGFDVSQVRTGRKPGTKVFTVRDAPAGVPTLMLSAEPAKEPA